MAIAEKINEGGIVTIALKVAGNLIPDTINLLSVSVEKKVNRIAKASIVIADGEIESGGFEASSSALFVPGAAISIEAGYDNNNKLIFKGIITAQNIRIDEAIGAALEIECRDESIKMTASRKSLTYTQQKDSEIISSLIANYSGLSNTVANTATVWPQQVQYYVTDWDYMLSLAEANGLIVTTINGTISVFPPGQNNTPILKINYGENLISFNAKLNAINQLPAVKASAWDHKTQALNTARSTPDISGPGNLSTKKLSAVMELAAYNLQTTAPLANENLQSWSQAQIVKSEFSKIIGEAKFQGSNLVEPATYINFSGLGDRFNGDHFIAGLVHDISDGNWTTEVFLGMSTAWFTQEMDIMASPASGLVPGARGLLNATVKKISGDPDGQYRILLDIPMFDTNAAGTWARLSSFYAGNGAGAFFLPEIGDEVIIGFLNEDPRYPIILGSMYSNPNKKPAAPGDDQNRLKSIITRSGISLQFDDEDKILTLVTPGSNAIVLSDKDKQVTVKDQNGNSFVMSASGISISSDKDINIASGQKVNISGNGGVTIHASGGDVEINGMNIKETAAIQYKVEAAASAEIKASGELTLQAAMIMIN